MKTVVLGALRGALLGAAAGAVFVAAGLAWGSVFLWLNGKSELFAVVYFFASLGALAGGVMAWVTKQPRRDAMGRAACGGCLSYGVPLFDGLCDRCRRRRKAES